MFYRTEMLAGGLVASICFGSQLLVFKKIMIVSKDTFSIGFGFLFSCGLFGLLSLGVEIIRLPSALQELSLIDILGPISVGVFTAVAIVLANIAAGIGIAGISNSIIHCSLVIVTLFNYFVFNQIISFEQFIGIILTIVGGVLLALDGKISQRSEDDDDRHNRSHSPSKREIKDHVNETPII